MTNQKLDTEKNDGVAAAGKNGGLAIPLRRGNIVIV